MLHILPLLAQDAAPQPSLLGSPFFLLIIMFAMMYFLMIRPQRKAQRAQEEMIRNLRTGDKVVTLSGIHGIISGLTDKTISVKVADGLSLKFERAAVARVVESKADGKDKAKDAATDEAAS